MSRIGRQPSVARPPACSTTNASGAASYSKRSLLYEAAPLAFVVEQAGGRATDGCRPMLDIVPESLHQKTPLVIGSKDDVAFAARILSAEAAVGAK